MKFSLAVLIAFPLAALLSADDGPNVVILMSDDQGHADLSCIGICDDVETPNIDRISENGIRFTHAYSTSPVSNGSRAALITGCYHQRQSIRFFAGRGIHLKQYPTLAEILKTKDYRCGYIGKLHYGGLNVHQPRHRCFPTNHGFDYFYGFGGGRKNYLIHNRKAVRKFQKAKRDNDQLHGQNFQLGPMWKNDKLIDVEGFTTELFGNEACEFIDRNHKSKFYLHVAFNAVHNFTHQLPAEYLKQKGLKGMKDWDPAEEEFYDWYRRTRKPNNPEGRAHYLGQLYYLDREIGRILDRLSAHGLTENTIVIFVGANGGSTPIYANNGPLRGSKYTLYEGGIRVPLLISWPNQLQKPTTLNNIVSGLDILPTLCSLVGADPPKVLDGMDLTPLLRGQAPDLHHETLVWDTGRETAIRRGKWKLKTTYSIDHTLYEMVDLELGQFLYDLEADPGEKHNLADKHKEIVRELNAAFEKWRKNTYPQRTKRQPKPKHKALHLNRKRFRALSLTAP